MRSTGTVLHWCCQSIVVLLSLGLIFASAAPLLHSNAWWVRIFDFPRIQLAAVIVLNLIAYAALRYWRRLWRWQYGLVSLLGLALIWQLIAIIPYTPLYPKEMENSREAEQANRISLLIFNVLAENRNVSALRDLIQETEPDVILLSEPTQWWLEQLSGLERQYPYTIFQPQDNEYGLLLFSRLELIEPKIRFLVESEIPSFLTNVRLRSGRLITLYGVHPRPPGLKRDTGKVNTDEADKEGERQDTDTRDAELMLVAKEVKKLGNKPVIVAGDFNDVAWSHTTHLFQRIGGLLDPRVGRGLYNTFDTESRLMRYPLDHAFASEHFLLAELRRLPDVGSDHFPFLVVFDYDARAAVANDEPQPDQDDKQEADKAIREGQSKD